jgi:signal transduction histidine kinase/ActR/RegA family two-component response regulator
VHPDGRVLFLKANGLVLRNPDGTPERMLGVNADITKAKRAEEELRRAYAEVEAKVVMRTAELEAARIGAEEANRAKDLFLATLSHELRTPLSAILSWSQLIERGMLPPEKVKTAIRTITENAWAQSQLISDLLDVSRILTGKINIDRQPILVQDVAGAAIEAIRVTAEQRGLTIEDRFEKSSLYVMADPARLKQALLNLLSNAIKFTPAGGRIVVSVGYANTPGGKDATISIRDTGVGIRPEFLPQLFARFSQADSSSVRVHGGLGLGLSLVRSLVEMQGGSVKAESPGEGKGATFTVALPLLEADIKRAMLELPTAEQARNDELAHLKVLLVEDNDETREALSQVLISYGADLVAAESAEAALRELKRFSPDIIVSDIAMPKESGHSLMRKIRALGKGQGGETPAIALTAFAEPRDRDDAFASGFQEYLTKPIDADRLVRTVARLAASA